MDSYKAILYAALSKHKFRLTIENIESEKLNTLVEHVCYKAIQRIRRVLDNETLDDFECIERIVKLLEGIGTDGGSRHDFG